MDRKIPLHGKLEGTIEDIPSGSTWGNRPKVSQSIMWISSRKLTQDFTINFVDQLGEIDSSFTIIFADELREIDLRFHN